ncbi:MAG: hypothetical protein IPK72_13235 [Candidatus Eisenbacteria bacterium]|nr:hypothetical protein [Candidatus Eisenbacteria bacterium]
MCRLLERMLRANGGALITDAGMPGISDPGFLLAIAPRGGANRSRRAARGIRRDHGPPALRIPPEPFLFSGYVPATSGLRETFLREGCAGERTVVVFETPRYLLRACLEVAQAACPDRPIAICRR